MLHVKNVFLNKLYKKPMNTKRLIVFETLCVLKIA